MSFLVSYTKSLISVCFVGLEWVGYGGVCHNEYLNYTYSRCFFLRNIYIQM